MKSWKIYLGLYVILALVISAIAQFNLGSIASAQKQGTSEQQTQDTPSSGVIEPAAPKPASTPKPNTPIPKSQPIWVPTFNPPVIEIIPVAPPPILTPTPIHSPIPTPVPTIHPHPTGSPEPKDEPVTPPKEIETSPAPLPTPPPTQKTTPPAQEEPAPASAPSPTQTASPAEEEAPVNKVEEITPEQLSLLLRSERVEKRNNKNHEVREVIE
jgi:hypothetical protein